MRAAVFGLFGALMIKIICTQEYLHISSGNIAYTVVA